MSRPIALAVLAALACLPAPAADATKQWAQWRGPSGTGVAPLADPPVEWSEERNVRWKTALPGLGHSSPVVWGDRVYVTTAVPFGEATATPDAHGDVDGAHDNVVSSRRQKFVVLAVDRDDGSIVWERTVREELPHESAHVTASWASASPVTDGKYVFAFFGSHGLYALDTGGNVVWELDLGDMQTLHGHGEGSSPALYRDTLVVNWDHQDGSFIVALDKKTGKQKWRVLRDEVTSWSTPLVVADGGSPQVIVAATGRVRSYDLKDGAAVWETAGLARNVVASPVAADGFVYVGNSYDRQAMLAIRLDGAAGDLTGTEAIAWTRDRDTPYVPSPVLYGDTLCFLEHNRAILSCLEAQSGRERLAPRRLADLGTVFASPVGAAGRLYVVDRDGAAAVVRLGGDYELLAVNRLDDSFSASPAVAGGDLLLRGERHLYCLSRAGAPRP